MQFISQSQSLVNWLEVKVREEKENIVRNTFERKILRNPKAKPRFLTWRYWTCSQNSFGHLSYIIQKAYRVRHVILQSSIAVSDNPDAFSIGSSRVTDFVSDCQLVDKDTKEIIKTPTIIAAAQACVKTVLKNRGCNWTALNGIVQYGHFAGGNNVVYWPLAMFVPHSAKIVKAVVNDMDRDDGMDNRPSETSDEDQDEDEDEEEEEEEVDNDKVRVFATAEQTDWKGIATYWHSQCPVSVSVSFPQFHTKAKIKEISWKPDESRLRFSVGSTAFFSQILTEDDPNVCDKIESINGTNAFFSLSEFIEAIQPKLARNRAVKRKRSE